MLTLDLQVLNQLPDWLPSNPLDEQPLPLSAVVSIGKAILRQSTPFSRGSVPWAGQLRTLNAFASACKSWHTAINQEPNLWGSLVNEISTNDATFSKVCFLRPPHQTIPYYCQKVKPMLGHPLARKTKRMAVLFDPYRFGARENDWQLDNVKALLSIISSTCSHVTHLKIEVGRGHSLANQPDFPILLKSLFIQLTHLRGTFLFPNPPPPPNF